MLRVCLFALFFNFTWVSAAEPLTAKQAADGWVMLYDGESTFGWEATKGVEGKAGLLIPKGGKVTTLLPVAGELNITLSKNSELTGFTLEPIGDEKKALLFTMLPKDGPTELKLKAEQQENGEWKLVGSDDDQFWKNQTKLFKLNISAVQGPVTITQALWRPTGAKPIFTGKNLDGWKVFAGDPKKAASKFEATDASELRVTNGPGDLQTEAKYGDFCLQFECKTQGTALNSGIFFRCLPDQYQNGYEAQIQNAFKDNDRTKPADFGTGAIYRRIASRKVVSDDKEWFTMTVMPIGPRLRTWVNGYPTVDWTDTRPADDNARKGLCTKPGHLSIQGHDPTTDILFRNFRILSLDAAK
ncbi:MAG: 3-keto-disaccharide hydrolase [Fimbriiglobus sp.]